MQGRLAVVYLQPGPPSFYSIGYICLHVELKQSARTTTTLLIYLRDEGGGMVLTATNSSTVFGLDSFSQP